MITRKIKIETISKVKDFVNEISKVDVNADLSNPDRRYIVDAKSILGMRRKTQESMKRFLRNLE